MLGEVQVDRGATVVTLHGDLDMMTVEELRTMLDDVIATDAPHVTVDLNDVAFVDVMSLSVILGGADHLRERGGQLMVRGASAAVRRICAVLNAEDILAPIMPIPRIAFAPNG